MIFSYLFDLIFIWENNIPKLFKENINSSIFIITVITFISGKDFYLAFLRFWFALIKVRKDRCRKAEESWERGCHLSEKFKGQEEWRWISDQNINKISVQSYGNNACWNQPHRSTCLYKLINKVNKLKSINISIKKP